MNIQCGKYIYTALSVIEVPQPATTTTPTRDATPELVKVYPVIAAFNSAVPPTPFIVYQRTGADPNYTKAFFTGEITNNYSVTVVDNQYTATLELAQTVIDTMLALSYATKEDMRFGQVLLTDVSEDFVDGLFLQTLSFEINTIEILP